MEGSQQENETPAEGGRQKHPIVERPYACPKCGWGNHRTHGRSMSVDIDIRDGQVSLVDAEDFEAEVECQECGAFFDIIYPPVGNIQNVRR